MYTDDRKPNYTPAQVVYAAATRAALEAAKAAYQIETARLIAAAPDLLAALVGIRDALNVFAGRHDLSAMRGYPAVGTAARAVERAISRATGSND